MASDDEILEIFDKASDQMRPALRAVYEAGVAASQPCGGGCDYNNGPDETCSQHGRPVAEVWGIVRQVADDRDKAIAEAVAAERARAARIAEELGGFEYGPEIAAAIREGE